MKCEFARNAQHSVGRGVTSSQTISVPKTALGVAALVVSPVLK